MVPINDYFVRVNIPIFRAVRVQWEAEGHPCTKTEILKAADLYHSALTPSRLRTKWRLQSLMKLAAGMAKLDVVTGRTPDQMFAILVLPYQREDTQDDIPVETCNHRYVRVGAAPSPWYRCSKTKCRSWGKMGSDGRIYWAKDS